MPEAVFYDVMRQGLWVAVTISLPILSAALLAGLVVGLSVAALLLMLRFWRGPGRAEAQPWRA
jgi:flagellar biosynthesis protein FliQ